MTSMVLLFCIFSVRSYGQLVQFADTTGQWHVVDTYPHGSPNDPGFIESMTTEYYFLGDTLISGDTWSKMMAWPFVGAGGVPERMGLAREAGDLVLFMDTLLAVGTLYDFSNQPGDSVYYPAPVSGYLHVSQVDSILIAGVQHRVIQFDPFLGNPPDMLDERWIEGMGSIHGPLFPRYPRSFSTEVPADSLVLSCYSRSDTLVWSHPNYATCVVNIILQLGELLRPEALTTVWPNPGRDWIWFKELPKEGAEVSVFDARGVTVLRAQVRPGVAISVGALPSGFYSIALNIPSVRAYHVKWMKE